MISKAGSPAVDLPVAFKVPRPRRVAILIPLAVLVSTLAVIGWSVWPMVRPARQVTVVQAVFDRAASVQTGINQDRPARDVPTVQAPGWLEAEPFYIACTALADGIVERIEVLEGDYVEQGTVVARLVAEDAQIGLRRAEAELAQAEAALDVARAEHDAAEQFWEAPVELNRAVETRTAALAESEAELAQLPSLVDSALATLAGFEEEADRVRLSAERGATNDLERILSGHRAQAQRAADAALRAREPILTARTERLGAELRAAELDLELRIEDRRRLTAAAALVVGAESSVMRALALRDEAALELERMVIRAPISGYVQRRLKAPGDKVIRMMDDPHSAHLLRMYDPQRIQVRVDIPLADASHISVGQACEVVVEVLPDRVFRGEVLRITHEADLQKNTLQVKVKVLDPAPILRPEMLTRVKFLPPRRDGASAQATQTEAGTRVLIPAAALDDRDGSPRVWIVTDRRNGRGVLASRPVTVVDRSPDWLAVVGNIQPGALLVLGLTEPKEGETVVFQSATGQGARS